MIDRRPIEPHVIAVRAERDIGPVPRGIGAPENPDHVPGRIGERNEPQAHRAGNGNAHRTRCGALERSAQHRRRGPGRYQGQQRTLSGSGGIEHDAAGGHGRDHLAPELIEHWHRDQRRVGKPPAPARPRQCRPDPPANLRRRSQDHDFSAGLFRADPRRCVIQGAARDHLGARDRSAEPWSEHRNHVLADAEPGPANHNLPATIRLVPGEGNRLEVGPVVTSRLEPDPLEFARDVVGGFEPAFRPGGPAAHRIVGEGKESDLQGHGRDGCRGLGRERAGREEECQAQRDKAHGVRMR